MLIKKWSFLIRCLQGHRPEKEGLSHFGNTVSVVMKLVHRQWGGPDVSLVLKTSPSKLISNKKRRAEQSVRLAGRCVWTSENSVCILVPAGMLSEGTFRGGLHGVWLLLELRDEAWLLLDLTQWGLAV